MISILCDGSIEAFSDLFYLAHRGLSPGETPETVEVLRDIGQSLTEGERYRASDDTVKLLDTFCSIGKRYLDVGKAGCAIMFYTRALAMARNFNAVEKELACLHSLGQCEENRGNYAASSAHFETIKLIAGKAGKDEEVLSAAAQLIQVRTKEAGEAEKSGDNRASLRLFLLGLSASKQCNDSAAEAKLSYEAGRVCILCRETEEAIQHLQNYVRENLQIGSPPPSPSSSHSHFPSLPLFFLAPYRVNCSRAAIISNPGLRCPSGRLQHGGQ